MVDNQAFHIKEVVVEVQESDQISFKTLQQAIIDEISHLNYTPQFCTKCFSPINSSQAQQEYEKPCICLSCKEEEDKDKVITSAMKDKDKVITSNMEDTSSILLPYTILIISVVSISFICTAAFCLYLYVTYSLF